MVQSYKKKYEIGDHFDTIIIGSGMGSLATGVFLAKEGQKVLILERHYIAGGFTHIFKRKGYEWDVGIHYIGDVKKETSLLKRLFDYVTDGNLKWADMGEVYDRAVFGDKTYDFVKGVSNFKAKMIGYFPEEEEAIHKYVDMVFLVAKASKNYFFEKVASPFVRTVFGGMMRKGYMKYARKTTYEVLRGLTSNEELIKVLTAQYGDYGLPPKQSSFAMHASLVRHYFWGGYFPVGGSAQIVETMAPIIHKNGGAILVKAEVDEIIIEGSKAVGVKMSDGKEFRAKNIISNAGILNTYKKLMPADTVKKHKLDAQIKKVKESVAHVCLYIGLKGEPDELKLPKANYWIYPEKGDHDSNVENYLKDISKPFPVVYVSFPAAKDPSWTERYPGKSTIDIITLVPYEKFSPWEEKRWKKRGEDYDKFKEEIAQRLLEELFRREPQLRGKVDYYELSTPLSTRHFVNYEKGEIYGLEHGPDRFEHRFLRPTTPIKNFYLTGQDIVTAGVGSAAFSGILTASAVSGKNLLKKLLD